MLESRCGPQHQGRELLGARASNRTEPKKPPCCPRGSSSSGAHGPQRRSRKPEWDHRGLAGLEARLHWQHAVCSSSAAAPGSHKPTFPLTWGMSITSQIRGRKPEFSFPGLKHWIQVSGPSWWSRGHLVYSPACRWHSASSAPGLLGNFWAQHLHLITWPFPLPLARRTPCLPESPSEQGQIISHLQSLSLVTSTRSPQPQAHLGASIQTSTLYIPSQQGMGVPHWWRGRGRGLWESPGQGRLIGCYHRVRVNDGHVITISVQFSSMAQSCPTLYDPMDCSTPGLPVHHHLPELSQTHVHWVGDAHQTILSSVIPFSSCLQYFPASGSFPMSRFFASGGQSVGVSALASVLPMNIQDWFPLRWLVWSPCSPRASQESSPTPQFKIVNSLAFKSSWHNPRVNFPVSKRYHRRSGHRDISESAFPHPPPLGW